jgi:hypothetical protein
MARRCTSPAGSVGQGGDELVEAGGVGQQRVREAQLGVEQLAPGAGGDDEVAVGVKVELLLPLDAVSQVHRHGDRSALRVQEPLPADGEQVGLAGQLRPFERV